MCKGANVAVMADMNYDGLTIIFINCRPSLVSTGASGHFFLSSLVAVGFFGGFEKPFKFKTPTSCLNC